MEKLFASHNSSNIISKPLDMYRVFVVGDDYTYTPKGYQSREDAINLAEDLALNHNLVEVRQPVEIYYQLSNKQVYDRQEYNVIYSCCTISLD
jgi:hypothetical protein